MWDKSGHLYEFSVLNCSYVGGRGVCRAVKEEAEWLSWSGGGLGPKFQSYPTVASIAELASHSKPPGAHIDFHLMVISEMDRNCLPACCFRT